jgi:hypothetical protein
MAAGSGGRSRFFDGVRGTLDEITVCPQNIGSMGDAHEDSVLAYFL